MADLSWQATLLQGMMSADPPTADEGVPWSLSEWREYRGMVRSRLTRHLHESYTRTWAAWPEVVDEWIGAWLATSPPVRLYHEVAGQFGDWVLSRADVAGVFRESLAYEREVLRVKDARAAAPTSSVGFAFDRAVAMTTAWSWLALEHAVWEPGMPAVELGQVALLWRDPLSFRVRRELWPTWLVAGLRESLAAGTSLMDALEGQWSDLDDAESAARAVRTAQLLGPLVQAGALVSTDEPGIAAAEKNLSPLV